MGAELEEGHEENDEGCGEASEASSSMAAAAAASPKSAILTQQQRGLSGASPAGASLTMTNMLDGLRSDEERKQQGR